MAGILEWISKHKALTVGIVAALWIGVALILVFSFQREETPEPVTLTYWRPAFDPSSAFDQIIKDYEAANPYVTIEFRTFEFEEYENAIVSALAEGRGPDIWAIHDSWLPEHVNKLAPMPEATEDNTFLTLQDLRADFPEVVEDDFVRDGQIYALPLSINTLALFYNRTIFNNAGIIGPPQTWDELAEAVQKITKLSEQGQIAQSGAALGTAENINRSIDILYLLMLQSGTPMTNDAKTAATFDSEVTRDGEKVNPGLQALTFYTDFANPDTSVYTWNELQDNSIDAFIEGDTAMMLNYSYQVPTLDKRAPKLNYDVAAAPQLTGASEAVNFANYWGEAVAASSAQQEEAWKFVQFITTAEEAVNYVNATGNPVARRDLIAAQAGVAKQGIFADQILTARSWYRAENDAIETIFFDLIDDVNFGRATAERALGQAEAQVTDLMVRQARQQ